MTTELHFTTRMFYLFAFLLWSLGAVSGVLINEKANTNKGELPACQEDEYLYPRDDYKGPGKNDPKDYGCFHFDSVSAASTTGFTCQLDDNEEFVVCLDNATGEVIDVP